MFRNHGNVFDAQANSCAFYAPVDAELKRLIIAADAALGHNKKCRPLLDYLISVRTLNKESVMYMLQYASDLDVGNSDIQYAQYIGILSCLKRLKLVETHQELLWEV